MRESRWSRPVQALLDGKVIRLPGQQSHIVTGRISHHPDVRHKHRVNVRWTPDGVVAWLTKKENP